MVTVWLSDTRFKANGVDTLEYRIDNSKVYKILESMHKYMSARTIRNQIQTCIPFHLFSFHSISICCITEPYRSFVCWAWHRWTKNNLKSSERVNKRSAHLSLRLGLSISFVEYQFECLVLLSIKHKICNRSPRIAVYEYARFWCISFDFDFRLIRRLHGSIKRSFSRSSLFVHFKRLHCNISSAASVIVVGWILVLIQKWALLTQFFQETTEKYDTQHSQFSHTQCIHAHIHFCGIKKSTTTAPQN